MVIIVSNKKFILPEFIEAELIAMPNISEGKLEEIKAKIAEQLAINEKLATELKNNSQPNLRGTTAFVSSFIGTYVFSGTASGTLSGGSNLPGPANDTYAYFNTTYNSTTNTGQSIYAIVKMTVSLGRASDIHVYAKLGSNPGAANYVKVYYSTDNMATWSLVGQVLVTTSGKYLVGSAPANFTHLMVGTAAMSTSTSPSHIMVDTLVMEY